MDNDKLMEFLRAYADACKDSKYFEDYAPFYTDVSMPGGYCQIVDKNLNPVAAFYCNHDPHTGQEFTYRPSMPVSPIAIAFANFCTEMLNQWPIKDTATNQENMS